VDFAVMVEGPVLAPIHRAASSLWQQVRWAATAHRPPLPVPPPVPARPHGIDAALVVRDNFRHRRDIEAAYIEAIARAKKQIVVANAYFFPGRSMRLALTNAASRGVDVVVLLQGKVEYRLLHFATHALYARLLRANIRIFEYHHSFLHAKVAVIDDSWATVGSSNIDPFSLLLAREANLIVRDNNFAETLRIRLERIMASGSREVCGDDLAHRSVIDRVTDRIAYTLVRLAIGLTRYGGQEYRD
jgi:cardiolipin synthase A/B